MNTASMSFAQRYFELAFVQGYEQIIISITWEYGQFYSNFRGKNKTRNMLSNSISVALNPKSQ